MTYQAGGRALLSVVVPAHNEEDTLASAAEVFARVLGDAEIPFEVVFVDDGSKDATWQRIVQQSQIDPRVHGVKFTRNFGKEAAILAGLTAARGDCAVVIDCDLQHPPVKIVEMYRLWQDGFEIIEGVKESRGAESMAHRLSAGGFYRLMSRALGFDVSASSDFKLLDRRVVDVIVNMRERNTFFRALSYWTGFKTATVTYEVQKRIAGKSSWSILGLFKYAFNDLASFTTAPMQLVTVFGFIMFVLAILQGVESLVQWFRGTAADGFTTVIILLLFIGSITMISLGLIGFYIARIYEEVKGRPRYLVDEECGAE